MGPSNPICERCDRKIKAGMGCAKFKLRNPDGTVKKEMKVCKDCKAVLSAQQQLHFNPPPPPSPTFMPIPESPAARKLF